MLRTFLVDQKSSENKADSQILLVTESSHRRIQKTSKEEGETPKGTMMLRKVPLNQAKVLVPGEILEP
jgi:hypothetical protein